jgi:hypothetical protein
MLGDELPVPLTIRGDDDDCRVFVLRPMSNPREQTRTVASMRENLYDVPMKEFSVRLRNRPGQLAALTMLLADAGVEIDALATVTDDGHSHVRFVVQNVARTRRLLMNADVAFDESEILDMFLPRGTGSLAHMVDGLARSGINIDSLYLLHSNAEGFHVAVTVDNTDAAIQAIAG